MCFLYDWIYNLNFPELFAGGIIGLATTLLLDWLRRKVVGRKVRKAYAGAWTRSSLIDYKHGVILGCDGATITIRHAGYLSIEVTAYYDPSRGTTKADLEVHHSHLKAAEGPYSYPIITDACHGHAGWYKFHLVNDGELNVYYEGTKPIVGVNGYEVWTRKT